MIALGAILIGIAVTAGILATGNGRKTPVPIPVRVEDDRKRPR